MRAKKESFATIRIAIGLLALVALVAANGCGDGKITRYPVTGTVLVDGQPAEGAMVIFCPVGGTEEFQRERPFGTTDASGKYELRTFVPGDGAPEGNYKVMVRWLAAGSESQTTDRDRGAGGSPDRLKGRYFNLETSGLTATVDGATEVPPFDLKSQ
jgi:hypothetical protein